MRPMKSEETSARVADHCGRIMLQRLADAGGTLTESDPGRGIGWSWCASQGFAEVVRHGPPPEAVEERNAAIIARGRTPPASYDNEDWITATITDAGTAALA